VDPLISRAKRTAKGLCFRALLFNRLVSLGPQGSNRGFAGLQ
jgi:hypothetical protein